MYLNNDFAVIITYHFFDKSVSKGCTCSISDLDHHLTYLTKYCSIASISEILMRLETGHPLPPRTVCIMVDDGDESFYELGWPIFRKHRIPLHLNLTCGFMGKEDKSNPQHQIIDNDRILELLDSSLVSLGSHSMTHPRMTSLPESQLEYELGESKEIIETLQGYCDTFAYPYGNHRYVTLQSEHLLYRLRYRYAFTTTGGVVKKGCDRYRIGRSNIASKVSQLKLASLANGAHPTLRYYKDRFIGRHFYSSRSEMALIGLHERRLRQP